MSRKLVLLVIYRSLSNKFFKIIKLSLNIISEVLSPKPVLFVTLPRRLENTEKNFRALGPRCHLAPCAHRPKAARLLLAVLAPGLGSRLPRTRLPLLVPGFPPPPQPVTAEAAEGGSPVSPAPRHRCGAKHGQGQGGPLGL